MNLRRKNRHISHCHSADRGARHRYDTRAHEVSRTPAEQSVLELFARDVAAPEWVETLVSESVASPAEALVCACCLHPVRRLRDLFYSTWVHDDATASSMCDESAPVLIPVSLVFEATSAA